METNNSKSEGSSLNVFDVSNHENENTKSVLKCNLCRKDFFFIIHIYLHMWECLLGGSTCQIYAKAFSTKGNLKHHLKTHTGEIPFHCEVCGKDFSYNSHLKSMSGPTLLKYYLYVKYVVGIFLTMAPTKDIYERTPEKLLITVKCVGNDLVRVTAGRFTWEYTQEKLILPVRYVINVYLIIAISKDILECVLERLHI